MAKIVYRQMPFSSGAIPTNPRPPGQKLGRKSLRVGANFWCVCVCVGGGGGIVMDEIDTCIITSCANEEYSNIPHIRNSIFHLRLKKCFL